MPSGRPPPPSCHRTTRRPSAALVDAWFKRLHLYKRLPGDHKGNRVARFIYKGAGVLDDSVI